MKKCTKCGQTKQLDDFAKHKYMNDGRATACKQCRALQEQERRNRLGDSLRERNREKTRSQPERHIRAAMINRCTNPNDPGFVNYGGRGIAVCQRWMGSFENFLADMGPRPSSGHSIDRIDNDGPYSPENCRWATRLQQNCNSRSNHLLTLDGRTMCLADWAREAGLTRGALKDRLRRGWELAEAIRTPMLRQGRSA